MSNMPYTMDNVKRKVAIINKKLTQTCWEPICNLIELRVFQKMCCL